MLKKTLSRAAVVITLGLSGGAAISGELAKHTSPLTVSYESIAANVNGFSTGSPVGKGRAFVFFDPQCPYCNNLWGTVKKLGSQAFITWVPVAIMNKKSSEQAATILRSSNPVAAMNEHESNFEQGGIEVNRNAAINTADIIKSNTRYLRSIQHRNGVPYIVTKDGAQSKGVAGALPEPMLREYLGIN